MSIRKRSGAIAVAATVAALLFPGSAECLPGALVAWNDLYSPASSSAANAPPFTGADQHCGLCHNVVGSTTHTTELNAYGNAVRRFFPYPRPDIPPGLPSGVTPDQRKAAIRAVESLNSDNHPTSTWTFDPVGTGNLAEIQKNTQPGWTATNNLLYAAEGPQDSQVGSSIAPSGFSGPLDPPAPYPIGPAAGGDHTCTTATSGGVFCWGYNASGQLGNGTTSNAYGPSFVALSNGAAVTAGDLHTCALTTGGGVKCWGYNFFGQLGDGRPSTFSLTPVDATGLAGGVIAVAAGRDHTCALITGGGVKCWGDNFYGQVGVGAGAPYSYTPVDVSGLGTGVSAIAAGERHTCALMNGGGVKCWGDNRKGQIGVGAAGGQRSTPNDVIGLGRPATVIAAGGSHTCALLDNGRVKCWGYNLYGQLGDLTTDDSAAPVDNFLVLNGTALAAGRNHTCALRTQPASTASICWGDNSHGQLGEYVPAIRIAAGGNHTCVLTSPGGIKCWGENHYGALGDGTTNDSSTPVDVRYAQGGGPSTADLAIALSHEGDFYRGQVGAQYAIVVTNTPEGVGPTNGTLVTVTVAIPVELTVTAMGGVGWNCTLNTTTIPKSGVNASSCTRSDTLGHRQSYPTITLTVNVASVAPSTVVTSAQVVGGGYSTNNTATDPTNITATVSHDADLAALAVSAGVLSPSFASAISSYSATVASSVASMTVTPTLASSSGSVRVNGLSVASGAASPSFPLASGHNLFNIVTKAQDGTTTRTYVIDVNSIPLSSCTYSLTPSDLPNYPQGGGFADIVVGAVDGCPVAATSFQPWVSIFSQTSNGTSTTIRLQIAPNAGGARATSIVVAGRLFLVTQQ